MARWVSCGLAMTTASTVGIGHQRPPVARSRGQSHRRRGSVRPRRARWRRSSPAGAAGRCRTRRRRPTWRRHGPCPYSRRRRSRCRSPRIAPPPSISVCNRLQKSVSCRAERPQPDSAVPQPRRSSHDADCRVCANRFLVLGRAGMDLYADPPGTRIEEARAVRRAIGGSAANIAVALARQGCRAALLTRVSDDAVGRFCLAELDALRRRTGAMSALRAAARAPRWPWSETRAEDCQTVIYRNGAADFALTRGRCRAASISRAVARAGRHRHGAGGGTVARAPRCRRLRAARAAGRVGRARHGLPPLFLGLGGRGGGRSALEAARAVDIVVGNDEEFGAAGRRAARGLDHARALARGRCRARRLQDGASGARHLHRRVRASATGIFRTAALKPTGAGDAFMGGLLAGLRAGRAAGRRRAARLGHRGHHRGRASAAPPPCPTRAELDAFLPPIPTRRPERTPMHIAPHDNQQPAHRRCGPPAGAAELFQHREAAAGRGASTSPCPATRPASSPRPAP